MNPASRVLKVIDDFAQLPNNSSLNEGWKTILSISEGENSDAEVFAAVQAFFLEVRSVQLRLRELGVPEDLFSSHASRLRNSFNPTQLGSSWSGHRESILSETMRNSLGWASWTLKKFDEHDLDLESLASLQISLQEQEELLANATLPFSLKETLESQVLTLKSAIRLYKIQGATPLREAVHRTVGDIVSEKKLDPVLMSDASAETKSIVQKALLLLTKSAEIADKGSKVAKFAKEMYEWVTTGVGYYQAAYPALPSSTTGLSA